jgi:holin-like protein
MIGALTTLLIYQLAGEVFVQALGLPVPGPVIGMLALFLTLLARRRVAEPLQDTANGILQHLSLLFVPAGVGVMIHAARVREEWLAIGAALVASTVLTIAVTAFTMRALMRLAERRERRP